MVRRIQTAEIIGDRLNKQRMTTVKTIAGDFDKARYDRLVKAYEAAYSTKDMFVEVILDGRMLEQDFAKYLIQYLDPHFKNMK